MAKLCFIGIDPGINSAFVAIPLSFLDSGKEIIFEHKRNAGLSWFVSRIIAHNLLPLVIATDKKIIPSRVRKISSLFNSFTFSPQNDLKQFEKKMLIKQFGLSQLKMNDHERDALTAVLFFIKHNQSKIDKFLQLYKEFWNKEYRQAFLTLSSLFFNKSINREEFRNLIKSFVNDSNKKKEILKEIRKQSNIDKQFDSDELLRLFIENDRLRRQVSLLREKITFLEKKIKNINRSSRFEELIDINKSLKNTIISLESRIKELTRSKQEFDKKLSETLSLLLLNKAYLIPKISVNKSIDKSILSHNSFFVKHLIHLKKILNKFKDSRINEIFFYVLDNKENKEVYKSLNEKFITTNIIFISEKDLLLEIEDFVFITPNAFSKIDLKRLINEYRNKLN